MYYYAPTLNNFDSAVYSQKQTLYSAFLILFRDNGSCAYEFCLEESVY